MNNENESNNNASNSFTTAGIIILKCESLNLIHELKKFRIYKKRNYQLFYSIFVILNPPFQDDTQNGIILFHEKRFFLNSHSP